MKDWVCIGKFGRVHGVNGHIKIYSFTDPMDNFILYEPKYACIENQWQKINFEDVIVKNKFILAKVKNYNSREEIAKLVNVDIAIKDEQLPKLTNEYYWHQLIGLKVVNQENTLLGTVSEIMPTGSNDVLVVTGSNKRHLIPYRPEVIIKIDNNEIVVDWDSEF